MNIRLLSSNILQTILKKFNEDSKYSKILFFSTNRCLLGKLIKKKEEEDDDDEEMEES